MLGWASQGRMSEAGWYRQAPPARPRSDAGYPPAQGRWVDRKSGSGEDSAECRRHLNQAEHGPACPVTVGQDQ